MRRGSIILLLLMPTTAAKRRKGGTSHSSTHVAGRKRECETECAPVHEDERANCVLRCQSESCYEKVYLPEELEPGEIDV